MDMNEVRRERSELETYIKCELSKSIGTKKALESVERLIDLYRIGTVPYTPGNILVVDNVDCTPDRVRRLEGDVDRLRDRLIGE